MVIQLGSFDPDIQNSALEDYIHQAQQLTGLSTKKLRGEADGEWVGFAKLPSDAKLPKVAELQSFLKQAGFFPFAKVDGICGYRTNSAIRLFQEYLRSVEGDKDIGFPDGKFGQNSTKLMRSWQESGKLADWTAFSAANPSPECALWLELLNQFKQNYTANPNAMLKLVNAYAKPTDTVKPEQWDFDPNKIQLIGIRRNEALGGELKFDDFFVLLINGLAFKFRGSTDPGKTKNAAGLPFLVMGQHHYRFGWHKLSEQKQVYQALKPLKHGVLVVRTKDSALTEADLARGLECNNTINVHWGGEGDGDRNVGSWSEGCQVFNGKSYINHQDKLVDCSKFAAPNYSTLGQKVDGVYQTKGAYAVLTDLVAALTGSNPDDNVVRYTMLYERDLALSSAIGADKAKEILARFKA